MSDPLKESEPAEMIEAIAEFERQGWRRVGRREWQEVRDEYGVDAAIIYWHGPNREQVHFVHRYPPSPPVSPTPESPEEKLYPCLRCDAKRTKDEGGAIFSLCDDCYDKEHPGRIERVTSPTPEQSEQPASDPTELKGLLEDVRDALGVTDDAQGLSSLASIESLFARLQAENERLRKDALTEDEKEFITQAILLPHPSTWVIPESLRAKLLPEKP